ncbi:hypothetical protein PVAP13_8KG268400 [Panicum virgatum]|uniref:Uncharacterized protein n=1 Tax=Panicum virgatum TaxID=38727 RepID=A0A8T0PY82_PANVG|nr:hypothetical protein PVAP13_8KG268400 [Panicum virgatum]
MVSSLKAALMAVAVFAMLVMSSQGHPKKPLCSDCLSLCNANCTPVVDARCSYDCSPPVAQCDSCKSQILPQCCLDFCSGSNGNSSYSCCPDDCISGNCTTCSCDNCITAVQTSCAFPCSMHASDILRCQNCRSGAAQQCYTPCMSACNDHCVKK